MGRLYLRSNIIDWSQSQVYFHHITFADIHQPPAPTITMSEEHFDQWEHYNFEEKVVRSRNSGKQRSKLEAALNTNRPSPGGHERKIVTKLRNAERNKRARGGRAKQVN